MTEPLVVSPTPTFPPERKVIAGAVVAAVTWAALHFFGYTIDPGTQTALIPLLMLAAQYLIPPSVWDVVRRVNNDIVKLANATPGNSTNAVVVDPQTAARAAATDIATGAVPKP